MHLSHKNEAKIVKITHSASLQVLYNIPTIDKSCMNGLKRKSFRSYLSQMFTNCSISCWLAWLLHAVGHVLYSRMRLKIYDYSNMKLFITIKAILLLSSALRMTIYRIYIINQMNGILQARKEPLRVFMTE